MPSRSMRRICGTHRHTNCLSSVQAQPTPPEPPPHMGAPGGHGGVQQPRLRDPAALLALLQRDEVPQAAGQVRDDQGPKDGAEEASEGRREVQERLQLRHVRLQPCRPAAATEVYRRTGHGVHTGKQGATVTEAQWVVATEGAGAGFLAAPHRARRSSRTSFSSRKALGSRLRRTSWLLLADPSITARETHTHARARTCTTGRRSVRSPHTRHRRWTVLMGTAAGGAGRQPRTPER